MRHTSDATHIDHVVIAILRQEDRLVMVQSGHPDQAAWFIPGGLVEPGELVTEALVREAREETGARVEAIGPLIGLSQIDLPAQAAQVLVLLFEVAEWQGTLQPQDPDGEISGVELVTREEAISRLQRNGGWPGVGEPLLAYLRGEAAPGTLWVYREGPDGQRLVASLSPAVAPN